MQSLSPPHVHCQAIKDGDVKYHANPMNMQAEAGERVNMEYGMTEAVELDGVFIPLDMRLYWSISSREERMQDRMTSA